MKSWTSMLLIALTFGGAACASQGTVLYSFKGSVSMDGANPYGGVIFDAAGNLYGTTELGGSYNEGTIYQLSPASGAWTESRIFNFRIQCNPKGICRSGTGNLPMSKLVFDDKGNLYAPPTRVASTATVLSSN